MPFCCERCHKTFKDNFNLRRHIARKSPCVIKQKVDDSSGVNDVSGNTYNITINNFTIFVLGEDNVSQFMEKQIGKNSVVAFKGI